MKKRTDFLGRESLRKVSAGVITCAMAFGLVACGSSSGSTSDADNTSGSASSEAETESTTANTDTGLDENASGATEVSFWHYFTGDSELELIVELCNEYNAMQDEIYVVPTYLSSDEISNQLTVGAVSGELPDIATMDCAYYASFVSMGVFDNIDEELNEWEELDHFYDSNLDTCRGSDGELYGLPQNTNCLCLAVNLDLLEEAGYDSPPTNVDDFENMALALTNPDDSVYGFAMSMTSGEGTFQLLPWLISTYNGESVNIDDLTADSAVHGLSVIGDLASQGALSKECVSWSQGDAWNQFCAGKAAMCMMGTWHLAQTDDIDFNYTVVELPVGDEGTTTSIVGGENIGVCAGANEREACIDFIEWFTSSENEARWGGATGKLSVRDDAVVTYDYAQEYFEIFQDVLASAQARGPHAQWPTINDAISAAGQEVVTNGTDAADALATAMETINSILEEDPLL